MKNFYKWINKWENNYIEKKLKELDEHPERNKTSSGILEETLIFLFFAIFFWMHNLFHAYKTMTGHR